MLIKNMPVINMLTKSEIAIILIRNFTSRVFAICGKTTVLTTWKGK